MKAARMTVRTAPHTLDQLHPGQSATVRALDSHGPERRRLMDLGLVPGTVVAAEMSSPLGDPVAYRVRGALVALRRAQAQQIHIEPDDDEDQP